MANIKGPWQRSFMFLITVRFFRLFKFMNFFNHVKGRDLTLLAIFCQKILIGYVKDIWNLLAFYIFFNSFLYETFLLSLLFVCLFFSLFFVLIYYIVKAYLIYFYFAIDESAVFDYFLISLYEVSFFDCYCIFLNLCMNFHYDWL